MKPIQLIVTFLLLPLLGFTQSTWDYDSLPKRNPHDLGFIGNSAHITDYYSRVTSKDGRKVKAYYFMSTTKNRTFFDCPGGIPTHTERYDTTGKKIKEVLVSCHYTLHYNKTTEKITYYTYQELDSFFVVTSITKDSILERTPYSKKYSTNDTLPDTTLLFFDKQTGYLSKEVNQQTGYVISYLYEDLQRLATVKHPANNVDSAMEYRYSYNYDTLKKDTVTLTVTKEKIYLTDEPVLILDDIIHTYEKYYYKKGKLILSCSCTGSHTFTVVKRKIWFIRLPKKVYKNKICEEGCEEYIYSAKKRKLKKLIRYEYY